LWFFNSCEHCAIGRRELQIGISHIFNGREAGVFAEAHRIGAPRWNVRHIEDDNGGLIVYWTMLMVKWAQTYAVL